jgi:WD40 repeat protein
MIDSPLKEYRGVGLVLAFSPSGFLASGNSEGEILFWDVKPDSESFGQTINPSPKSQEERVIGLAFSPDGSTLASASNDVIKLWDVRTGELLMPPLSGHEAEIIDIEFNPDGQILVSNDLDGNIILWNAMTGEPLGTDFIDGRRLYIPAFSPDGRLAAMGLIGEALTLLELTGDPASAIRPFSHSPAGSMEKPFSTVAFSPDSHKVATGSYNDTLVLWDVDPNSWQERACHKANRNLTLEEWEQFFGGEPYRPTCPDLPAAAE